MISQLSATNAHRLASFISSSPTSYHAAATLAGLARYAGFTEQRDTAPFCGEPGVYFLVRGGAFLAWRIPEARATHFRIVGSHTDSPSFKVKPNGTSEHAGFQQVDVEVYGGPLYNSWLNRELGLAGRLVLRGGEERLVKLPACMIIPQLAPHLDRSVNKSLSLNPQTHLHPVLTQPLSGTLFGALAEAAGVAEADIMGHDILAYPAEAPALTGDFLGSSRQDNLTSVHASFRAFLDALAHPGEQGEPFIPVLAAFDHEEIGSGTPSGAAGPILEMVLRRVARAHGVDEEGLECMLAASTCVSSDAGHSINPNYPEYYDPDQAPVAGRGAILKINAQGRYASDARSIAVLREAFERADARLQPFISNNAVACGTTIGPITAARLGISTVDVGVPLLSMHSAREYSHADDLLALRRGMAAFWGADVPVEDPSAADAVAGTGTRAGSADGTDEARAATSSSEVREATATPAQNEAPHASDAPRSSAASTKGPQHA
ncbi:M18 family aminopeptidase [Neoactinobaculum massilliense]|uniref:M18 family aminopeptidase n=1 Tax=Neoactinobaculum massilliense TaxID=2364794 RepID=UPI001F151490|nr:M18 family aminopeptidase [Neoactinobaculum massilliense]